MRLLHTSSTILGVECVEHSLETQNYTNFRTVYVVQCNNIYVTHTHGLEHSSLLSLFNHLVIIGISLQNGQH